MFASNIPTRRTLGVRRGVLQQHQNDENAALKGKDSQKNTGNGTISTIAAFKDGPALGTRNRAALGDVTNATKAEKLLAGKGKVGKVTKVAVKETTTRSRIITRRAAAALSEKASTTSTISARSKSSSKSVSTESTTSAEMQVDDGDDKENIPEEVVVQKTKTTVTAGVKRTSRVLKSTSNTQLRESQHNVEAKNKGTRKALLTLDVETIEATRQEEVREDQARKKVKTTTEVATETWDDLDADDFGDPAMVAEYVNDIFEYLRELEKETMPNPSYMDDQKELAWKMRGILVDWLIEVHSKFRLLPETLFLTVHLIDRFLSLRVVSLVKLQLVGITAMFIAAKYEEMMAPSISNFIYMADGGYTEDEILKAERYMLQTLEFNLSYPGPMSFLRRISKAGQYDIQSRTIAKYLMEISLLDHKFLPYSPSMIAAAATHLARRMLDRGPWDKNLIHYSQFKEDEIWPCEKLMLEYLSKPVKHESFFKKYACKKFMKASILVRDWISEEKKRNGGDIL